MDNEDETPLRELDDEVLTQRIKSMLASGRNVNLAILIEVEDRGLDCLESDPGVQATVGEELQMVSDIGSKLLGTFNQKIITNAASLGAFKSAIINANMVTQQLSTGATGLSRLKALVSDALKINPQLPASIAETAGSGIAGMHSVLPGVRCLNLPELDMEALAATSPAALNGKIINALEVGFGSIQGELVAQREVLDDMKSSLKTVEGGTPRTWVSRLTLVAVITAAVASLAGVVLAIMK